MERQQTTAAVVSTETVRSEASVRRETTRTEQSEMNRTIIEEPPPHYSSLFPPKTNNIPHVSRQQPSCQPQHESSHHQIRHSHPTPQYPNHCSVCYTALPAARSNVGLHHCHLHHTPNPLPGAIGHHYPAHHIPRELTVRAMFIGTHNSLIWAPMGQKKVVRCPHFNACKSGIYLGVENGVLFREVSS